MSNMFEYDGKEYWQGLLGMDSRPMHEDETGMLFQCMMMEQSGFQKGQNAEIDKGLDTSRGFKILEKRLEAAGVEVTLPLMMFLTSLCDKPGMVVVWAYTLNVIRVTRNVEGPVGTSEFAHAFPMGIPTDDVYQAAWNEQKVNDDSPTKNLVDNFKNWPGLDMSRFKEEEE